MYLYLFCFSLYFFFFFNDTATTEIYTLSLHDALPIFRRVHERERAGGAGRAPPRRYRAVRRRDRRVRQGGQHDIRSEEHTSELQSRLHLVCRLLLEKKKNQKQKQNKTKHSIHTNLTSL